MPRLAARLPVGLLLQALHAALPALGRLLSLHHVGVPPELVQLHCSRGACLQVLLLACGCASCSRGRCAMEFRDVSVSAASGRVCSMAS